jgi:hypothetical protein
MSCPLFEASGAEHRCTSTTPHAMFKLPSDASPCRPAYSTLAPAKYPHNRRQTVLWAQQPHSCILAKHNTSTNDLNVHHTALASNELLCDCCTTVTGTPCKLVTTCMPCMVRNQCKAQLRACDAVLYSYSSCTEQCDQVKPEGSNSNHPTWTKWHLPLVNTIVRTIATMHAI